MKEIRFESRNAEDIQQLYELYKDGWDFHRLSDHKGIVKHLYKGDMYRSLLSQNHMQTVYVDGDLAGVLMAKVKGAKKHRLQNLRYLWPMIKSSLYLGFHSRRSRMLLRSIGRFDKMCDKLLKDTKKKFDAELTHFITHSRYRGMGLGKKLIENFERHLQSRGAQNYYLYSDTESNYGFYEHMGFLKEAKRGMKIGDTEKQLDVTLFLYSKTLKDR